MGFLNKLKQSLKIELNINEKPVMPTFGQLDEYPSNIKEWSENKNGKEQESWKTGIKGQSL